MKSLIAVSEAGGRERREGIDLVAIESVQLSTCGTTKDSYP